MHDKTLQEDLRTTSAQVSATAERLDQLEAAKRELPTGDPRVIELSDEIERLAARLRRQTAIEGGLARVAYETVSGDLPGNEPA